LYFGARAMNITYPIDIKNPYFEEWLEHNPFVVESEAAAIRNMIPEGDQLRGLEIGLEKGYFARVLKIKETLDAKIYFQSPSNNLNITSLTSESENLPYPDLSFDYILITWHQNHLNNLHKVFTEALRAIKNKGALIIGFIDTNCSIGKYLASDKINPIPFTKTKLHSVDKVVYELIHVGFQHFNFCQTLFKPIEEIAEQEPVKSGYGEGSFVVIQAQKNAQLNSRYDSR
jgi:SAM-dependent methyltransferase